MDRSTRLDWFLAGRAMQGIGAGGQVALAFEAYATFTPAAAWLCLHIGITLLGAGTLGGPLLGELVATNLGWVSFSWTAECRRSDLRYSAPSFVSTQ